MKRFIWGILIVGFTLFSLSPTFYELSQKEKLYGRTFEVVHNYITDYNFYLSRIREGVEGRWTVEERYTSEPHQGSFIQIFYLFLGKVHVHTSDKLATVPAIYHASRVILGMTVLLFIVLWVRSLFPSLVWQVIAFLTAVTACVWPVVVPVGESLRFGGPMSWWTIMDNLQRITFLPHLLAGQALLCFLLFAAGNEESLGKPGNWMFLGILSFVLGMIFPPGLVFVLLAFGVMIFLSFFADRKLLGKKDQRNAWLTGAVYSRIMIGVVSLPSFLYFTLMFSVYPWKRLVEFDVLHPLPFAYAEYIQALGPTLPLGLLGLVLVLVRKDTKFFSTVSWVLAWIFCLIVFRFIPQQSPLRFSEMLPHLPLGILTTYLFYQIWCFSALRSYKKFYSGFSSLANSSPIFHIPPSRSQMNPKKFFTLPAHMYVFLKFFSVTIPIILITVGLGCMASSFLWQKDFIDQKIRAGWPVISMNNYIVYPLTTFTDAISFLGKTAPHDAIILSDMTAGNYIPAYTGRRVYVGHDNTVNLEKKLEEVRLFFQGGMKNAGQWLLANNIQYIFFGPQEKWEGKLMDLQPAYPFLKEAYKNNDVAVYSL